MIPTAPRSSTAASSTGRSRPTAPAASGGNGHHPLQRHRLGRRRAQWATSSEQVNRCPSHAVFYILVADVEATCSLTPNSSAVRLVSKHLDPGPGAPTFAYLADPSGNRFGVFAPPDA